MSLLVLSYVLVFGDPKICVIEEMYTCISDAAKPGRMICSTEDLQMCIFEPEPETTDQR